MFKNRFLVVIGVVSLLMVTMAVSTPRSKSPLATDRGLDDFYQRHPDWTWAVKSPNIGVVNECFYVPVSEMACANQSQEPIAKFDNTSLESAAAFPDYFQRHPEVSAPWIPGLGASDYFQRHPELSVALESSIDTTDYFFRHLHKNASSLAGPFGAEQVRREYFLGERYGVMLQGYIQEQALREYWLGERYGQTP